MFIPCMVLLQVPLSKHAHEVNCPFSGLDRGTGSDLKLVGWFLILNSIAPTNND